MDYFSKDRLINFISYGHIFIDDIVLSPPTLQDKSVASNVYDIEYSRAISMGLMPEKELICYMIESEEWSVENNIKIQTMQDDIRNIVRGLLSLFLNKTKLLQAKIMIKNIEKLLVELLSKKNQLLTNSADNYALLKQQRFLISRITKNKDGFPFWKTAQEFDNYQDLNLIDQLSNIFFSKSHIPTNTLREIARTQPWHSIWTACKNCGNPFNTHPTEWTNNQSELISWSNTYDMVYEAYERPCKEIIEDDLLLDSWFIKQSEKIESQANKTNIDNTIKNNKNGRQETFIFTDKEGAKDVYKMNDTAARIKLKAKEKMINKYGVVKDQETPESQEEMRIQLTKQISSKGRN